RAVNLQEAGAVLAWEETQDSAPCNGRPVKHPGDRVKLDDALRRIADKGFVPGLFEQIEKLALRLSELHPEPRSVVRGHFDIAAVPISEDKWHSSSPGVAGA